MKCLNECNGADKVCDKYEKRCLEEFSGDLVGVIMGVAYGGDVERIAKSWKGRGKVFGFDTFDEGHPKHLSTDITAFDAMCMDYWYKTEGVEGIKLAYQQNELKKMGIDNVELIKGEVTSNSCDSIERIHYAFLDMDIPASMDSGYKAVKDKIVPGGYLLLHDVNNIQPLFPWYNELKKDWEILEEYPSFLGVLRKPYESRTSD